jgi:hypothetical protein
MCNQLDGACFSALALGLVIVYLAALVILLVSYARSYATNAWFRPLPQLVPQGVHVIVTLVHGTWTQEAGWTRKDSKLREGIFRTIRDRGLTVEFVPFRWCGANTFFGRRVAAQRLRQHLLKVSKLVASTGQPPVQLIVAHSHGGNIALQSLVADDDWLKTIDTATDPPKRLRIAGIACLSTPFIACAQRRDRAERLTYFVATALPVVAATVVTGLQVVKLGPVLSVLLGASVGGVLYGLSLLATRQAIPQQAAFTWATRVMSSRLLILRTTGDETSGLGLYSVLKFALERSCEQVWARILRPLATSFSAIAGRVIPTRSSMPSIENIFAVVLVTGIMAFAIADSTKGDVSAWEAIMILGIFVAVLTIVWGVAFFAAFLGLHGGVRPILYAPASVLMGITGIFFGVEQVFGSSAIELSAEASPAGTATITMVGTDDGKASIFRHSQVYENPQCLEAVAGWVNECLYLRTSSDLRTTPGVIY